MISDSGYDPSLAGGRGGYVLGSFQGGPDPNAGRDAIAQSVMAQQGMPPPQAPQALQALQALQAPQAQGMNDARGPDQGAPFRQAIGQGWSIEGNNVFDPSGAIVGRHGLQQYGAIPGLTPTPRTSGPGFNEIFPHSPTSSFDFTAALSPAGSSPTMQGGAPTATGRDAFSSTTAKDWGGVFDPSDAPTMSAPAMTASPHATPTFDVDQNGMPNAPDVTPAAPNEGGSLTDPGAQSGADFAGGDFGGFGGFDAGGMGMDTAGGVG